ncbi:MAG TPA: type II toxin-antitoxin system VapC family toxin [Blastocatellia bacterium]|nr:type II toxin-antitoxin system VapC family toxin [Blastocatellia bacterium]
MFERVIRFEIKALCPALVLVETVCVIRRRTNSEDTARSVYKSLSSLPSIIWFDVTLAVAERACLLGAKTGLKGGDSIVLQVAEEYGIPLLTKDKEMRDKAPTGILVFEPSDVPL